MINFKDPELQGPSSVAVIAILVLLGTLGVMLFVPKPTGKGISKQRADREFAMIEAERKASALLVEYEKRVEAGTWTLPAQEIGPAALSTVNRVAKDENVNVLAFRPQRVNEMTDLTQYPFLVSLDGGYPAVLGFIKKIQDPKTKLAVNLVQIASADGATDKVTASVSLIAYRRADVAEATSKGGASRG